MHIPLGDDDVSDSIRSTLAKAPVALVLAGHTHGNVIRALGVGRGGAIELRTAAFGDGAANWRRVRLFEDRIEVYGTGRPDSVEKVVKVKRGEAAGRGKGTEPRFGSSRSRELKGPLRR
jgi:hypothetical protein